MHQFMDESIYEKRRAILSVAVQCTGTRVLSPYYVSGTELEALHNVLIILTINLKCIYYYIHFTHQRDGRTSLWSHSKR